MSQYETPDGRWFRELNEAAEAAEAEGRYEERRLADKFARGEVTFDEVLQLFREGKVYRPEPRYPGSHRFDHVEADEYGDPFWIFTLKVPVGLAVTLPHLSAEQFTELTLARSGYADDGDPRNVSPTVEVDGPAPV